jgi:hypothetical protein
MGMFWVMVMSLGWGQQSGCLLPATKIEVNQFLEHFSKAPNPCK